MDERLKNQGQNLILNKSSILKTSQIPDPQNNDNSPTKHEDTYKNKNYFSEKKLIIKFNHNCDNTATSKVENSKSQ